MNENQLIAAATTTTYQHRERKCKWAPMQMSLVLGGGGEGVGGRRSLHTTRPQLSLKHNAHLSLCSPTPTLLRCCSESFSQRRLWETILWCQSDCSATVPWRHPLTQKKQARVQQESAHKQTQTNDQGENKEKINTLTYLSWRRRANIDSLKLLVDNLHTVGTVWSPGAKITTAV